MAPVWFSQPWGGTDDKVFPFLECTVGFMLLVYALHTYLDERQYKALQKPTPPTALAKDYTISEYKKTQAYNVDKWWFALYQGLWSTTLTTVLLLNGYLPWMWDKSTAVAVKLGYDASHEIKIAIIFMALEGLKDMILGLPWSLWATFIIEERHGFNKQTLRLFFLDKLKELALALVLMPPILAGFLYILQHTGPYVALYVWAFLFGIQIFLMTIYPVAIAPLFNKFNPLPEGSLREQIEKLAGSLNFPLKKLYVIDGSTRSAHSNAYMYGFFNNKRIVLYDTLIDQCSAEQVVAVLAHELGHWKLRHTVKNLILAQVVLIAQLVLFTFLRTSKSLFVSFGFQKVQPVFIAFELFQLISAPMDQILSFLNNILSRKYEFQADHFAVELGHSQQLQEALVKLDAKNRSATHVDPWYSTYHYSHPPLIERLAAIQAASKKTE
ncbi:hypothetical protein WJX72_010439 [[Myrmecia] bisecta]|uniref:CAAX prenyl protease n=1 Tax=[Myrmecia] bisecta TaxID=41462 RepID=A0AAW1R9I1_9CHLO